MPKNYCNRTLIVKVIVENVVTCYVFWDTVYVVRQRTYNFLLAFNSNYGSVLHHYRDCLMNCQIYRIGISTFIATELFLVE